MITSETGFSHGSCRFTPYATKRPGREERQLKVHPRKWFQLGEFKTGKFCVFKSARARLRDPQLTSSAVRVWNREHKHSLKRDIADFCEAFPDTLSWENLYKGRGKEVRENSDWRETS